MKRSLTSEQQRLVLSLVHFEPVQDGVRYIVAAGDKRAGQRGVSTAVIGLKHTQGYEVVLLLDSGKYDSFSPLQLFPESSGHPSQPTSNH